MAPTGPCRGVRAARLLEGDVVVAAVAVTPAPSKSEVSAGTSDVAVKPFPFPPPPPSSREPRNWTESAITSTLWRLPEPSFASHSRPLEPTVDRDRDGPC